MKIGVDISQIAYTGTGVARYTEMLIKALVTYDKKNSYIFFYSSLRNKLPENIKKIIEPKHQIKRYFFPPTLLSFIWNTLHILPIELFIGKIDLFFSSDWTEPPSFCKKITTIHDMVIEKLPETSHQSTQFSFSQFTITPNIVSTQKKKLKWVSQESDIIICDSQSTKEDVIHYLSIGSQKLHVIYPAINIDEVKSTISSSVIMNSIKTPYILTVGNFEPRKNILRLIQSFVKLDNKNLHLYIVGSNGWNNLEKLISPIKEFNIFKNNVHILGYVKDVDLHQLYTNAHFFIFPSLYEGFGYPIVEAMRFGCPVASSHSSSLKEIVNGYGLLFDPLDEQNIANTMKQMYNNTKLLKELKLKSLKRANDFSLKNFADQILFIINTFT